MKNVFNQSDIAEIIARINKLSPSSQALWGKMEVGQMLAHCNVTYEMVYDNIHPAPNFFIKFILKLFVKNVVVSEKPFKQNSETSPAFIIKDSKDFEKEKKRLIDYINKTQKLGDAHFEGKESNSFGALSKSEWNNLFAKHLDHHLGQFGV